MPSRAVCCLRGAPTCPSRVSVGRGRLPCLCLPDQALIGALWASQPVESSITRLTLPGIGLTAGLYNPFGSLVFFFPKRVTGATTQITAHDSSRRADMRVVAELPSMPLTAALCSAEARLTTDTAGKLTAVSKLACGLEAKVSLSGGLFGANGDGQVLLLNDEVPVAVVSRTFGGVSAAVEGDDDTVSAGASLGGWSFNSAWLGAKHRGHEWRVYERSESENTCTSSLNEGMGRLTAVLRHRRAGI